MTAEGAALSIEIPEKLAPVFDGAARYRGAYGGRGSGKTRSFAKMCAVRAIVFAQAGRSGMILGGREYMNSLDDSSMAEIKTAIESEPLLSRNFEVGEKFIRTHPALPGSVEFKFVGLRQNLESIKSKAKVLLAWVDEAEQVSESGWQTLTPTVREPDSEIWVTWNPKSKKSPTHKRFREAPPEHSKIVQLNWRDNPFFPDVLEYERVQDKERRPDTYGHVWEGEFATIIEGAYFAALLNEAQREGRIGNIAKDPLLPLYTYHDIGGAGAKADAYVIWVIQYVGNEIRILNHYETVGQVLESHVRWMREHHFDQAKVILPHDGAIANNVTGKRYEDHWRDAGFSVETIPNQGRGAAMLRVEAVRRIFNRFHFNETTTEAGRDALANYHEKRDDDRAIGLGPEHDWSSHSADSFGLMAIHQTDRMGIRPKPRDYKPMKRRKESSWATW